MRRAIVPCALMLALATGVVLTELRLIVLTPIRTTGVESAETKANAATIQRFYDAVNAAIEDGETAEIERLVDEKFVEHTVRPGLSPDRAGFLRSIRSLHATQQGLRLDIRDPIAAGDRVTALVSTGGARAQPGTDLPLPGGRQWGAIDVFRLREGRIVEHWGDVRGLAFVEPLVAVTVPLDARTTLLAGAIRQTYEVGQLDRKATTGPSVLLVEDGHLTVRLDKAPAASAAIVRRTMPGDSVSAGQEATLAAGDTLVLSPGSFYQVRNDGKVTARALTVWAAQPTPVSGNDRSNLGDASRTGQGEPSTTPVVETATLVQPGNRADAIPLGSIAVSIGRIALAPGATIAQHQMASFECVVVEEGSLAVTVRNSVAWVRNAAGGATMLDGETILGPGTGASFEPGEIASYRTAGEKPAVLLVVRLTWSEAPAEIIEDPLPAHHVGH